MTDILTGWLWELINTKDKSNDDLRTIQALALLAAGKPAQELAPLQQGPLHPDGPEPSDEAQRTGSRHPLIDPAYDGYWATKLQEFGDDELYDEPPERIDPQTGFLE